MSTELPIECDARATTPHYERVKTFMMLARQAVRDQPSRMTEKERLLRARLILEEAFEFIEKGLGVELLLDEAGAIKFSDVHFEIEGEQNNVELADGFADLSVVSVGTMIAAGIADEAILKEVDANNLSKLGPGHRIDENGKLIKPPGHKKPDILSIIMSQIKD